MGKNIFSIFKSALKDSKISYAYILLKVVAFKLKKDESGYVKWVLKLYPRTRSPTFQKRITKFLLFTNKKSIFSIESHRFSQVTLKFCKVIKPFVSEKEKGLIIVSFEKELEKIVFNENFEEIQKHYRIVFIPSWTGAISLPLMALAEKADDTFFVLPVHWHERHSCNELSPHCKTLDFNAASWVNSDFYKLDRTKRDIDCLMVANFGGFKRHRVLFKAIKKLNVSVFCVGVPLGNRNKESIEREASEEGVSKKVTVIENPSQDELREYFTRAKSFSALSKREGSFIAVSEALISGSPVIMFKNAQIGTKRLISENNGRLVKNQNELVDAIRHFGNSCANYQGIRDEAIGLCDARQSSKRLNEDIKDICSLNGEQWSQPLTPIYCVRFKFHYFDDEKKVEHKSDYSRLQGLGVTFET